MKCTSETLINLPADRVDLVRWITNMSDLDYQACSRSHRAAGTFREGDLLGMVNVESIGGNLLVQHYRMTKGEPNHVVMQSQQSRVYISHLVPATVEVIWAMEIQSKTSTASTFRCTVETNLPKMLRPFATLSLLPTFIQRHTREETLGFATDIERKTNQGLI